MRLQRSTTLQKYAKLASFPAVRDTVSYIFAGSQTHSVLIQLMHFLFYTHVTASWQKKVCKDKRYDTLPGILVENNLINQKMHPKL